MNPLKCLLRSSRTEPGMGKKCEDMTKTSEERLEAVGRRCDDFTRHNEHF